MFRRKRFLAVLAIILLVVGLGFTLYTVRQEQELRSQAAVETTLFFQPTSTSQSPITKQLNETFTLDVMINPGTNAVSFVKMFIVYDSSKFNLGANGLAPNTNAFPNTLEGPVYSTGQIAVAYSVGNDPGRAIRTTTKIATLTLTAKAVNSSTTAPQVAFSTGSQALSVGTTEQAAEDVLSGTSPAYILIVAPTPTPQPVPTLLLTANPTTVPFNGSSTLTWSSSNTTSCTASGGWSGSKAVSGSQSSGQLTQTTTFTLTCTGPGGNVTKSVTVNVTPPTPTATRTPTPLPTSTPVPPTSTPVPLSSKLSFIVFLHGIGNSGDNANPNAHSLSNKSPQHPQRLLDVEVYDANNQNVANSTGIVTYNASQGNFSGIVDMGTTLTSGIYTVKIKPDLYLRKLLPGIQTITAGQTTTMPTVALIAGDSNNDNLLNILDYNIIIGCYSDLGPAKSCNPTLKLQSDLNDDGNVNQFDYNLFLRELSVQTGE